MEVPILLILKAEKFTEINISYREDIIAINAMRVIDKKSKLFALLDIKLSKGENPPYSYYMNLDIANCIVYQKEGLKCLEFFEGLQTVINACNNTRKAYSDE